MPDAPRNQYREKRTIRYEQDLREPIPGSRLERPIGMAIMECEIEVVIDLDQVIFAMGGHACRSKGGRCQDGPVVVKRVGTPKEIEVSFVRPE